MIGPSDLFFDFHFSLLSCQIKCIVYLFHPPFFFLLHSAWLCTELTKSVIQMNTHTDADERKFQYKRWSDLCCAPPCSIQAKVLGPQLGNMCQPTLGGPLNNSLSQEQVAATWNSERRACVSVCVYMCVWQWEREAGLSAIWSTGTIPGEAETWMRSFYQATDWLLSWIQTLLEETLWFLATPLVMVHTNFESVKWAITRCAAVPPVKWIDPNWDQQAKSSQVYL